MITLYICIPLRTRCHFSSWPNLFYGELQKAIRNVGRSGMCFIDLLKGNRARSDRTP